MKRWFLVFCVMLTGCQQRAEQSESVFRTDDGEYVLTIVLDMSGSFQEMMAEDGKAWAFVSQVIDRYFRDRLGRNDKLILAQLSANDRALLWRGTPLQLRQEFASASAFRDWLASRSDPHGSRVYEGIVQAVEYTLADPIVTGGKGKAAVFILSDMVDTAPGSDDARDRAVNALAAIGKQQGVVGLYYVDARLCSVWNRLLGDAGVPPAHLRVEADIVSRPVLPSFE
jgi:hypothetical protein